MTEPADGRAVLRLVQPVLLGRKEGIRPMEMSMSEYRKRLLGCWYGKNIGGTLGAPFECYRGVFEFDFYTQPLGGEPLPNDDLDLQLVWLNAAERFGAGVNASILGEYWLSYITPSWSEYGAAKNNLRRGVLPPLSGFLGNDNRDSCGAFIRSEIWACLCPGDPQAAVHYAMEDAMVDHSREGVYAAVFCAALQSAAFVTGERETLLDIALSYIPQDCGVYGAVSLVREIYNAGKDWKHCRKQLLIHFPCFFGMMGGYQDREPEPEIPEAKLGYDAPCNIGLMVLGWYYGEGDFGRSLCIAAGCGEDADCTAATLGALFGIIGGIDAIPRRWIEPIGSKIITLSINKGDHDCAIPETVEELTERLIRLVPRFLDDKHCVISEDKPGFTLRLKPESQLRNIPVRRANMVVSFLDTLARQPFSTRHTSPVADLTIDYQGPNYIRPNEQRQLLLTLDNHMLCQQWLNIRIHTPEGFRVYPSDNFCVSLEQFHGNVGKRGFALTIQAPEVLDQPVYELLLAASFNGRHTRLYAPIQFVNSPIPAIDEPFISAINS